MIWQWTHNVLMAYSPNGQKCAAVTAPTAIFTTGHKVPEGGEGVLRVESRVLVSKDINVL